MNTKLNDIVINPEFKDLFSFNGETEKTEHNAQMISFRILSEIEKVCCSKHINKTQLAAMVGTSKSYITQLFRGDKSVNTQIMAKFEDALNVSFEIKIKLDEESYAEFLGKLLAMDVHTTHRNWNAKTGALYYCPNKTWPKDRLSDLKTDHKDKQVA